MAARNGLLQQQAEFLCELKKKIEKKKGQKKRHKSASLEEKKENEKAKAELNFFFRTDTIPNLERLWCESKGTK